MVHLSKVAAICFLGVLASPIALADCSNLLNQDCSDAEQCASVREAYNQCVEQERNQQSQEQYPNVGQSADDEDYSGDDRSRTDVDDSDRVMPM